MPIDYQNLRQWPFQEAVVRYGANDCIRYALSLGMAQDPLDAQDLQYVYEEGLRVVPTFLSTMGCSGAWFRDPRSGIQWLQMLHGEQRMRFHGAVPPGAELACRARISRVVDKGRMPRAARRWPRRSRYCSAGRTADSPPLRSPATYRWSPCPAHPGVLRTRLWTCPPCPTRRCSTGWAATATPSTCCRRLRAKPASTGPSCTACVPTAWRRGRS
jgi:hypothetical protein